MSTSKIVLGLGLVIMLIASTATAGMIEDAVTRSANGLVTGQQPAGSWSEFGFTGESVAGLAHAYELTGLAVYKVAAEAGALYCVYDEGGYDPGTGTYAFNGLYASGAYALTRISEISATPASNGYRTAVDNFYEQARISTGTQNYVNYYRDDSFAEDSSGVYDLARHTVSAYYVGATEKHLFRQGLIMALGDIDNGDNAPVMALGAAVWALSQTGPLDSTPVNPVVGPGSLWYGVTLADLPDLLVGQQTLDGSFNTTFDPADGSGFTETATMAALGLIAADEAYPSPGYGAEILSARLALAGGVDVGGEVYWEIGDSSYADSAFLAGETLEVLPEPSTLLLMVFGGIMCGRRRRKNRTI